MNHKWEADKSWENATDVAEKISAIQVIVLTQVSNYDVTVNVDNETLELTVNVIKTDGTSYTEQPALETVVKAKLTALINPEETENIITDQQEKIAEIQTILARIKQQLHANRNLCEDFVAFEALRVEEIVICADIKLKTDADAEAVLAEIYFLIAQFLAPTVCFYSIAELLAKGETIDQIFEGPQLTNGFIWSEELEKSGRRKNVRVSDLINIIMDIPGVIAIKNMQIGNIPLGDDSIASQNVKWCLNLAFDKNFVPRLNPNQSKITFLKRGIPFLPNKTQTAEILAEKNKQFNASKNQGHPLDLPIPQGTFFRLDEYTSIQQHYPENYGISKVGLPKSATNQRKAQANQLKGFLLMFDQILANYCAQLSKINQLFSLDENTDKTYFNQPLYTIPNGAILYKDFVNKKAKLTANTAQDSRSYIHEKWEEFKADANNSLAEELNKITENKETFEKRRSAFLDHLLARFAEQFTDYALLAYRMDGKKVTADLIADKIQFLKEYPVISYARGQAFNYTKEGWNNNNVSGLEKRISRLLGIEEYNRRNYVCDEPKKGFEKFKDTDKKLRFRYIDYKGEIFLKSEAYNSPSGYNTGVKSVLLNGVEEGNYRKETAKDGRFYFNLIAQNGEIIGTSNLYDQERTRDLKMRRLIALLEGDCSGEGFYLIEHLLLRPRAKNQDDFLKVSFDETCYCPGNEDAYSFRATCIMPYWVGRFTNMDFRRFAEQTIRKETPAHIFMKICWIDQPQMEIFQTAYKAWLSALQKTPQEQTELSTKQNELITILEELRHVYPVANLHDCQENDGNTLILGQSSLGTFIPEENE